MLVPSRLRTVTWLLIPLLGAACSSPDAANAPEVSASRAPVTQVTTPIKHVIVIVKENHTFDNYFGSYPGAEGTLVGSTNVCDSPTGRGPCQRAPDKPAHDMSHSHDPGVIDWDNGKMDGWSKAGGSDTGDGMNYAQYTEKDIPNYYEYARHFVLGDHFFANMIGPSLPGHMFTVAAQAGWAIEDPPTDLPLKITGFPPKVYGPHPYWGCDEWPGDTVPILPNGATATPANVFPCFDIPSIPDVLPAGTDWKFYGSNFDGFFSDIWTPFDAINGIRNDAAKWGHVVGTAELTSDIANHALPAVTWLVDQDQYSEHPHLTLPGVNLPLGGVCDGEGWTVGFVNQIMQSEYWQSTAILFTMDDYGGWHDHVPPPRQYGGSATAPYGLGFRLPLLIISPYAKPGFIFKEVSEQASIASFIEAIFHSTTTLTALDPAAQDGQANNLLHAFDFTQAPLPPLVLQPHSCSNVNDSLGGATGTPSGPALPMGGAGGTSNGAGGTGNSSGGAASNGGTGGASHAGGSASSVGGSAAGSSNGGEGGELSTGEAGAGTDPGASSGGTPGSTGGNDQAGNQASSGGSQSAETGGSTTTSSAGADDAAPASSHDSSGCGCRLTGSNSGTERVPSVGLALLAWVALRRRKRTAHG